MRQPTMAEMFRARVEAHARFAEWEASHPARMTPSDAVASIGALYQLLPRDARSRAVDPSGVSRMHDALRVLSR